MICALTSIIYLIPKQVLFSHRSTFNISTFSRHLWNNLGYLPWAIDLRHTDEQADTPQHSHRQTNIKPQSDAPLLHLSMQQEKKKRRRIKNTSRSRKAGRRSSESLEQLETGPFFCLWTSPQGAFNLRGSSQTDVVDFVAPSIVTPPAICPVWTETTHLLTAVPYSWKLSLISSTQFIWGS